MIKPRPILRETSEGMLVGATRCAPQELRMGHSLATVPHSSLFSRPVGDLTTEGQRAWNGVVSLTRLQRSASRIITGDLLHEAIRQLEVVAQRVGLPELTDRDRSLIARTIANLRTSEGVLKGAVKFGDPGHHNILSGAIREPVTTHLPMLQRRTDSLIERIIESPATDGDVLVLDTAIHGTVQLPTKNIGKGYSPRALGSDRTIGEMRLVDGGEPIELVYPNGLIEEIPVIGEFTRRMAIEIKGGSNAADAVAQHVEFAARAEYGYIILGGHAYRLELPGKASVQRLIIAPEGGSSIAAAERAAQRSGLDIEVLTYAREYEEAIQAVSTAAFAIVLRLESAAM